MKNPWKDIVLTKKRFVLLLVIPLLVIVVTYVLSQTLVMRVEFGYFTEDIRSETRERAIDAKNLIEGMTDDLEHTAAAISEYGDVWDPEVRKMVAFSHGINLFDFTFVSDAEGNAYAQTGDEFSVADQEYFQEALKGNMVFSEVMPSKRYRAVQIIACPLFSEDGTVHGVLFGLFNIETFSRLINLAMNNNDYIYVIDSNGNYVNRFDQQNNQRENLSLWQDMKASGFEDSKIAEVQRNFKNRDHGEFSYIFRGKQRYGCYMPLGVHGWQVMVTVEETVVNSHVHTIQTIDIIDSVINMICLSIMVFSVYLYYRSTTAMILKANQKAIKNIEMMQMAAEYSNQIIFEYDMLEQKVELKTKVTNPLFRSRVLYPVPGCFLNKELVSEKTASIIKTLFDEIKMKESCCAEIKIGKRNEQKTWYRVSMHNMYNEKGEIVGTVGSAEDITLLKKGEEAIKRKEEANKTLISNAILYARVDLGTNEVLELNGKESEISYEEFVKKIIAQNVVEKYRQYVGQEMSIQALRNAYQSGKDYVEVECLMEKGGKAIWVSCLAYRIHANDISQVTVVVMDIDKKKRKELALTKQAEQDGLTGLYNAATARAKITERLSSQLYSRENQVFALFDLDNFKAINDTFGHAQGDQVLVDVADILRQKFRSSDILGRMGGDEFVIMLSNVRSEEFIHHLSREINEALTRTYTKGDVSVTISASIGVAIAPHDGTTFKELYEKADEALYLVKKEGKNGYRRYQ